MAFLNNKEHRAVSLQQLRRFVRANGAPVIRPYFFPVLCVFLSSIVSRRLAAADMYR